MTMTLVLAVALASAISRAALNVFDRSILRQENSNVLFVSLANNILPLCFIAPFLLMFVQIENIFTIFLKVEVWLLALSVQINALLFGYALKRLSILESGIWGKLPDAILPGLFIAVGFNVDIWDIAFALGTTAAVLLLQMTTTRPNENSVLKLSIGGALIFFAVPAHALVSSVLVMESAATIVDALVVASCIIFMRSIYTIVMVMPKVLPSSAKKIATPSALLLPRAFFAITTQVTFVWALSLGHPVLAWVIFNFTGLIATGLAALFIGERPALRDMMLLSILTGAVVVRTVVGS